MDMPAEPRSTFIDVEGPRLHVASWGDTASPAVLLLHGMRDHARSWDGIAVRLARNHHVVVPDLRGHGDSGWVDACGYTMAAYVLDLGDVAEAFGLAEFALVGHSLGGAIAIRYAGACPDRVRALCAIEAVELPIVRDERREPKPYPDRLRDWMEEERARRRRRPRSYPSLAEAERRMAEVRPDLRADLLAHLTKHAMRADPGGGCRWKYDNAARLRAPDDADGRDLDQVLAAIRCPVLLAYGEASWIPPPPADRLARLRDHRLARFPNAGHWLHQQAGDAFLDLLIPFLKAQDHA